MDFIKEFHKQRLVIIVIAVVGIISTFLPWASVEVWGLRTSVSGISGDGWFVLIAMAAAIGLAAVGKREETIDLQDPKFKWGLVGTGGVSALVALISFINVSGVPFTSVGFGVFLAILTGAALVVIPLKPELLENIIGNSSNSTKDSAE